MKDEREGRRVSKVIGELHAEFDDAVERYVAFNNGRYDATEHLARVRDVIRHGEFLEEALDRSAPFGWLDR